MVKIGYSNLRPGSKELYKFNLKLNLECQILDIQVMHPTVNQNNFYMPTDGSLAAVPCKLTVLLYTKAVLL